jgi:outer membrane lipoprotein-sorting protein
MLSLPRCASARLRAGSPGRRLLLALLLVVPVMALAQAVAPGPPPLSADQIVRNLEQRNQARTDALHRFEATRTYSLHYYGFPSQSAQMVVTLSYRAPSTKNFKNVSQSGSRLILDHVLKKMIESEREAAQDQSRNALNSRNYEFALAGSEQLPEGPCYILTVSPRTANKFLYRGKIWVDAADFAVVKIDAAPAQNPSMFITRTDVHHLYKKVNGFWLPAENHTTSYLRFGGHAELSIEYQQYNITAADPIPAAGTAARNSGLTRDANSKAEAHE